MARPPLPDEQRRSITLPLRLSEVEREELQDGADSAGKQLSDFIRGAALEKAAKSAAKTPKRARS